MRLQGKVAVITGGGHNIGDAVGHVLASEGVKIAIFDLNEARASEGVSKIKEDGGEAIAIVGDVSKSADIGAMVKHVVREWGHIDILVNCAAISDHVPILELAEAEWRHVLEINLTGTFLCGQHVARQMANQGQGGAIVNFASGAAFFGSKGRNAYSVSKAGVVNLTMQMAVDLAPYKIRVNCIAPGATGSPVGFDSAPAEGRPFRNLVGRGGLPDDQARVVFFLVSEDSQHITGETINVDGGTHILHPGGS
jgi:NAD(P)-dependent dehydrogenase (short-subunit alcohol dehydrogenase family)